MPNRFCLKLASILFGVLSVLTLFLTPLRASELPLVRIGIVVDGPWERNDEIVKSFQDEILDLTRGEFNVEFPPDKMIQADWTVSRVETALDELLADPEVRLIIASGVLASNDICRRGPLAKPAVAPFVLDPKVQGIPMKGGASEVKNLSYITFPSDVKSDLEIFREVVSFSRVAFLNTGVVGRAIPELRENLLKAVGDLNIKMDFISVEESVEAGLDALSPEVEAVYVAPLLGLSAEQFKSVVSGLTDRKLPSFSMVGTSDVERGLLVGIAPDFNIPRLSRRIALNVQRILLGEDPSTFRVLFTRGERLTINMATARSIGVFPRWEILTEAELLHKERKEISRHLSLSSAAQEAIKANLDLASQERIVAAGAQRVYEARAPLLPQVGISGLGAVIDDDLGSSIQAQRTFSGSARFSQVIFSESARSNFDVQGHQQRSREIQRDQVRLDVIQAAASSYLNVLRAKTFERIQKDNLNLTRSNLELARVRESIGYSGPGEVYRWESQIATGRNSVIQANSRRNLTEMDLNRLLHRPLEESFLIEETGLLDPNLITAGGRLLTYIDNPWSFRVFRRFMVLEGLSASPELKQFHTAIAAQERVLHSTRRAFWSPTVSAQGELTNIFSRGGSGSGMPPLGGELTWNLGVNLSLPLFSGAGRIASLHKAREELNRLRIQQEAASERIELRIRSAIHLMGSSYAGIRLSRDAAAAARKNLELVKDSYSRGVMSILDLLDAQNASLVSELGAANAVYDFLVDLMEVERSVGRFTFFMNAEEVESFFKRLEAYFARSNP